MSDVAHLVVVEIAKTPELVRIVLGGVLEAAEEGRCGVVLEVTRLSERTGDGWVLARLDPALGHPDHRRARGERVAEALVRRALHETTRHAAELVLDSALAQCRASHVAAVAKGGAPHVRSVRRDLVVAGLNGIVLGDAGEDLGAIIPCDLQDSLASLRVLQVRGRLSVVVRGRRRAVALGEREHGAHARVAVLSALCVGAVCRLVRRDILDGADGEDDHPLGTLNARRTIGRSAVEATDTVAGAVDGAANIVDDAPLATTAAVSAGNVRQQKAVNKAFAAPAHAAVASRVLRPDEGLADHGRAHAWANSGATVLHGRSGIFSARRRAVAPCGEKRGEAERKRVRGALHCTYTHL
mmetsp:Transcript_64188/g.177451  ORF Transcript_64188/g.177451 Transcript_64188/m.177451 type:complete len:355 (+) Transcript_64188:598-1662(+)